ncbi:MAG TPA: MFS transporter, partial [Chloroflexota bacterium]|nr:MFS transporter [Chloroflexota bacterium]
FRAIQGLGAGSLMPSTQTIAGDTFPLPERARVQALFSSVWAVASVAGPPIGAGIAAFLGWRWAFYVNIPIGLAALYLVHSRLDEQVIRRKHHFDGLGTVTLLAAVGLFGYALTEQPASHLVLALLLIGSILAGAVFVAAELHAAEPMLPLSLFRNRVLAMADVGAFSLGGMVVGTSAFLPPFIQGVQGGSVLLAGSILTAMNVIWPIGSFVAGRLVLRAGYRVTGTMGGLIMLGGSSMLLAMRAGFGYPPLFLASAVLGMAFGFFTVTVMVSAQSAVPWELRGSATSVTMFFRTLGGMVALSIMGLLFNARLTAELLRRGLPPADPSVAASLLGGSGSGAAVLAGHVEILQAALHDTYLVPLALSLVGLAAGIFMPGGKAEKHTWEAEPASAVAG